MEERAGIRACLDEERVPVVIYHYGHIHSPPSQSATFYREPTTSQKARFEWMGTIDTMGHVAVVHCEPQVLVYRLGGNVQIVDVVDAVEERCHIRI